MRFREYPPRADADKRKISTSAEVLHLDDHMVIVNKPPGISLDIPVDDEPIVLDQLRGAGQIRGDELPMSAYMMEPRLSGIAVLARSEATLEALLTQISVGVFDIVCLALVRGRVESAEGTIEQPVRERSRTNPMLKIDAENGHPAITRWRRVDGYIGSALLECSPRPADPNIVRVHLNHAGLPLMVDPDYGGGRKLLLSAFKAGYKPSPRHPERPLIERVSLHVSQVSFAHPVNGERLTLQADLHKDFRAAVNQLDRFGRLPM